MLYVVCLPNGGLYVGITTTTAEGRFLRHRKSRFPIGYAIRKYGSENCRLVVLHRNLPWFDACELEQWYIKELEIRIAQGGYNLTAGGEGKPDRPASSACRRSVGDAVRRKWAEDTEYRTKMLDILKQGREILQSDTVFRKQVHAKSVASRLMNKQSS